MQASFHCLQQQVWVCVSVLVSHAQQPDNSSNWRNADDACRPANAQWLSSMTETSCKKYAQTADLTDLALHGHSCGMNLSMWLLHIHPPQCC